MKLKQTSSRIPYTLVTVLFIFSQFVAAFSPAIMPALASAPHQTTPIDHSLFTTDNSPLTLSRVQSSYIAGQTVVEFTLTNNLPVTRMPDIPETSTLTDTVDILATFAITDDVNTLRGLTLADTLATGTTLLAASGNPAQTGNTLTWTLPDLPPQGTATLSMTLQTPAQTSGFVNLDTGAQANAEKWGNLITATASPAVLIPTGIDAALTLPTADADAHDADMLWQSAALGQDALALFGYVQSLGYEAYTGSLRGTRGTLWGQAGNAPDKSSLLIAMLRAAGIPARYRHGALEITDAQTLIASMFPAHTGLAGSIPAGTSVSDPVNDPDLLALVSDHWWVEAYLPGSGWTNLDPSFADAQPGDVFATPGADDRIPELPDNLRHKVTFKLEVEQYSQFPIGGSNLVRLYPIEVTFNTVELASRPLTFGHIVETEVQGGVYSNVSHTYTPYFTVEGTDDYTLGETYQDLLTTFPLATVFTTGAWLTVETQDADGHVEGFTREVKDLIGQDVRLNGGALNLTPPPNNAPLFGPGDAFVMWFLPNKALNNAFTDRYREALFARGLTFAVDMNPVMELFNNPNPSPEDFALLSDVTLAYQLNQARFMAQSGLDFARAADLTTQMLEDGLHVRMIYDLPRIIALGAEFDTVAGEVKYSLDLRSTRTETLVAPGQASAAGFTANWLKGVSESYQEGEALGEFTGIEPITTARIFEEMAAQGIEPLWITPATMSLLDLYPLPSASTAYAKAALMEGKNVLIPSAPVLIDGEPTLGWWEIDPVTGETIGVGEDGLHVSLVEWAAIEIGFGLPFLLNDVWDIRNSVKEIWDYVVCHVVPALGGTTNLSGDACTLENPFNLPWPFSCSFCNFNRPEGPDPTAWMDMPAHQCPTANCGVERFVFETGRSGPIPLPDIGFTYGDEFLAQTRIGAEMPVTNNGSGGAPALELSNTPGSSALAPAGSASFDVNLSANFSGDVQVTAYAPDGWFITFTDEDTLTLTAPPDALAGDYTVTLVGQSDE
ncbi:MAG TPA: transglutaminase domain-containing protein, partial [Anaerolineales bacterium]|nr:transglutaminase domain-containing protein [Anaerolineales bacterium]